MEYQLIKQGFDQVLLKHRFTSSRRFLRSTFGIVSNNYSQLFKRILDAEIFKVYKIAESRYKKRVDSNNRIDSFCLIYQYVHSNYINDYRLYFGN